MSVSLLLGLVYLISELLLTAPRRSRSRTGITTQLPPARLYDPEAARPRRDRCAR
jgi:hypothetical protein